MTFRTQAGLSLIALALAAFAASCAQEELPQVVYDSREHPASVSAGKDAGEEPDASPPPTARPDSGTGMSPSCMQALASEQIPARIAVMSAQATSSGPTIVQVSDVVGLIGTHCGAAGCHLPGAAQGGFSVADPADLASPPTPLYVGGTTYPSKGEWALAHITANSTALNSPSQPCTSPDTCQAMPPPSSVEFDPWSQRQALGPTNEIVQLADDLQAWVAAGRPSTSFPLSAAAPGNDDEPDAAPAASLYVMSAAVGNGLTNLGNCIPDAALVGTDVATMKALDARFAALQMVSPSSTSVPHEIIGLPENLSDTDVTTFDSAALASVGVIAFVPQYPLWSDGSSKLRFVRVPYGTSITFDKDKQEFVIPPNTRFYKTFLKRIIDSDGNPSYRKIETRLIVARPDTVAPDGSAQVNALFGSYRWNDDETAATLVEALTNEGDGFEDKLFAYETNVFTHSQRHYAIPGSARCTQCHQGSPARDFVLGFRPVQLVHRPEGQGGVVEPSGPDEMTQLQRLVDYGVITGISSPSDILPLESTQGDRQPRNTNELVAQGYMMGNCSHCHNPRGYPSVQFPVLKDVLSFLPGPQGDSTGGNRGGIFQFPLEKFSPRIFRGETGLISLPYMTPSLLDNPDWPSDITNINPINGDLGQPSDPSYYLIWRPKWLYGSSSPVGFSYAPWRSLIYRNVDTPFTYVDDFAIYPHMPLNTAGYDTRAKQILGDWMVSVPAIRKRPDVDEYVQPYPNSPPWINSSDDSAQPYVEVVPGAPGYDAAVLAAQKRLAIFHAGSRPGETEGSWVPGVQFYPGRYASSPDTSDIVDPTVDDVTRFIPSAIDSPPAPVIGVPVHAHWVSVDLTSSQTAWNPKRGDWQAILVNRTEVASPGAGQTALVTAPGADVADIQHVLDIILGTSGGDGGVAYPGAALDATLREYALTRRPMGLWLEKPTCDWSKPPLSSVQTLSQARVSDHRPWMDYPDASQDNRHVFSTSTGAYIFNLICANCHGSNADSKGRLADNLANITGGNAVVADFRDGLFGPRTSPGAFRGAVLAPAVQAAGLSIDDWGARYMSFMALGGTTKIIPPPFLTIVGHSPVFGESRTRGLPPPQQANMLTNGRQLCLASLWNAPYDFNGTPGTGALDWNTDSIGGDDFPRSLYLEFDNGDAETWLTLCGTNNPTPIVEYERQSNNSYKFQNLVFPSYVRDLIAPPPASNGFVNMSQGVLEATTFPRTAFSPPDASDATPVVDENSTIQPGLTATNRHPWCGHLLSGPGSVDSNGARVDSCMGGSDCDNTTCSGSYPDPNCIYPPECPSNLGTADPNLSEDWAIRGAINAAFAVFTYLDAMTKGTVPLEPTYDQCDVVQTAASADAGP